MRTPPGTFDLGNSCVSRNEDDLISSNNAPSFEEHELRLIILLLGWLIRLLSRSVITTQSVQNKSWGHITRTL